MRVRVSYSYVASINAIYKHDFHVPKANIPPNQKGVNGALTKLHSALPFKIKIINRDIEVLKCRP